MATGKASNRCSKCQKGAGMCNCTGCKAFFCVKHFTDHRQELMDRFDNDVGVELNKLLEQIGSLNPSSTFCVDCFCQVDLWEMETIEKVHKAAAEVRRQLTVLTTQKQNKLTDKFNALKEEIHQRRGDEDFVEQDIKRLKEEIDQIQQSLKELTQPNKTKTFVIQKNEIDWNRLIYAEETSK